MDVLAVLTNRTVVLRAFLTSIAINAALGIWALLVDDFGDTQSKVLVSSFLVSAGMLSVLVNGPSIGRRVLWPVPAIGAGGLVLGFALLLAVVWTEPDSDTFYKFLATVFVIGSAAAGASLLALLPLRRTHEPIRQVAYGLIAALGATIVVVIWAEGDGDWVPRLIGIESILVAALVLTLPALSRFLPPDDGPGTAGGFCPGCGAPLGEVSFGGEPVRCGRCDRVFSIAEGPAGGAPGTS